MSDAFIKSNAALDAAVNSSESFEGMREALKDALTRQGVITRPRDGGQYGANVTGHAAVLPVPAVAQAMPLQPYVRRFYVSNDAFEVYGASNQELDQKEARLRAAVSGQ